MVIILFRSSFGLAFSAEGYRQSRRVYIRKDDQLMTKDVRLFSPG
jgi:hypothetical protein